MMPPVPRLPSSLRGLPTRFWWIWAGTLLSALATFVFLFLAVYLTSRGFPPQQVGLVAAGFGLGTLVAGPLGGTLADRWGRRPTLLAALVADAAFASVLAFARAPALIAAAVFAFGVAATAVFPALHAAVGDVVPAADRPRAFGLLYWANNVGIALSAAVGGAVGERSWVALFLADASMTLVFALVVWRKVPETRPAAAVPAGSSGAAPAGRGWPTVLRDRPFVAFVALFVLFLAVFFQFQVAAPIAMLGSGLRPAQIGRVLAVNGLLIGTLQPFAARVLSGHDRSRVLAAGALLVGAGYGGYALCATAPEYALATALWTLGEIATLPTAVALVADLAPPDLRGRYNGAYGLSFGAGQTLAPLVGGALLARAGPAVLFAGCLAACAAVAAGHLALGAARRAREARV
jgi:predicted MFS family arabinose efflux permease